MTRTKQKLMCPLGKKPHWSKAEAEDANPGARVERCGRCRYWHAVSKRGKGR